VILQVCKLGRKTSHLLKVTDAPQESLGPGKSEVENGCRAWTFGLGFGATRRICGVWTELAKFVFLRVSEMRQDNHIFLNPNKVGW
jgi:hypothetical protein